MKKLLVAMVMGVLMAGPATAQEQDQNIREQQLKLQKEQVDIQRMQLDMQQEQLRLQQRQMRNEQFKMWGLSLENEPIWPTRPKEDQ